jgi:Holliday junction resolvase
MSQRGLKRERALRHILIAEGWVVIRASMGIVDLVALQKAPGGISSEVRLIQVKSTADGPYKNFSPAERSELRSMARSVGATAWLIWWPPNSPWQWIPSYEWPEDRSAPAGGAGAPRTLHVVSASNASDEQEEGGA